MIRLRPYKPGDAWNLLEWWENAGEEDFLMWSCGEFSYPLAIEELDGYFARWCLQETDGWPMTALDEKGTPVGHFLVRKTDYEDAEARVGFIMTAPEIRGKGLGKEFAGQILRYVFQVLGMKKVSLAVFDKNTQAKACYEAAGFKAVSHIPDHLEYKGTVYGAYEMEAYSNE